MLTCPASLPWPRDGRLSFLYLWGSARYDPANQPVPGGAVTMKIALAAVLCLLILGAFGIAWAADTYVNGYFRQDGTYVQPHYRSAPDGNVWNNYSTRGNVNPYTGKPGTVDPYRVPGNSSDTMIQPRSNSWGGGYNTPSPQVSPSQQQSSPLLVPRSR